MTRKISLILVVCIAFACFAVPVQALSKSWCQTVKGNEYCYMMNTPDRNNWTWEETWSFGTPYVKRHNTVKVKIVMFGGYWTCNPRYSKVTKYEEKDEYGRLFILGKGEKSNGIFGMEKTLKARMQTFCK
jgi:hypothetical protein